ncbi:hypothetical protein PR048_000786 [Dryococelus australis]|uniref:Uncharacterized protein n=1 Tax=Dryococelus australis TaxID=614101 RepID=A0ABQ9IFL0_9NEOP|nr:hypothetical protein PR048_000786 [Dryococelus australis]
MTPAEATAQFSSKNLKTISEGTFKADMPFDCKEIQDYSDLISMYCFNQLIDHVLVNKTRYPFRIYNTGPIASCVSDHNVNVSEEHESKTNQRLKVNYSNLNIYLADKLGSDTLGREKDSDRMYNELIT